MLGKIILAILKTILQKKRWFKKHSMAVYCVKIYNVLKRRYRSLIRTPMLFLFRSFAGESFVILDLDFRIQVKRCIGIRVCEALKSIFDHGFPIGIGNDRIGSAERRGARGDKSVDVKM